MNPQSSVVDVRRALVSALFQPVACAMAPETTSNFTMDTVSAPPARVQ